MSALDLNAIKARAEAATEGPWFYNGYSWVGTQDRPDPLDGLTFDEWSDRITEGHSAERYGACPACGTDRPTGCTFALEWTRRENTVASVPASYGDTATGKHAADADFIAEARQDIPDLLAEVIHLRSALEAAGSHMEDMADSLDASISRSQIHEQLLIGLRAAHRALTPTS